MTPNILYKYIINTDVISNQYLKGMSWWETFRIIGKSVEVSEVTVTQAR